MINSEINRTPKLQNKKRKPIPITHVIPVQKPQDCIP